MGDREKKNVLERLEPQENLILGCAAGVGTKLINYPLLNFKNMRQQGLPITLEPKKVYRGLPMACLNLGGTTAVQFWFVGMFQGMLKDSPSAQLTPAQEMGAAFLGGLASGVPCSLWELTMVQQQRFGGSMLGTPARLIRNYGAGALTRGMIPTLGRESLYTMAMLGLAPVVQRELHTTAGLQQDLSLAAGALVSAIISATLSHPMDTVKTCMQGDVAQEKYPGVVGTGQALVKKDGVAKGLFKGLSYRIGLITTTFFLVNKLKVVLAPQLFPEKCCDTVD